jgi:hypothetical protein
MGKWRRVARLILLGLCAACGSCQGSGKDADSAAKGKQPDAETAKTDASARSQGPEQQRLVTFRPDLLLSDSRTAAYVVRIPPVRAFLDEPAPVVVTAKIVVECANRRARRELKAKLPAVKTALIECFGLHKLSSLQSTSGRMRLKEEIVARLQRMMNNKGVKQVYFEEFFIAPGTR